MVALIAVLLMVISALGIVAPERLVVVVVGGRPRAVGTWPWVPDSCWARVFLAGASRCRLPAVILWCRDSHAGRAASRWAGSLVVRATRSRHPCLVRPRCGVPGAAGERGGGGSGSRSGGRAPSRWADFRTGCHGREV